MEVGITHTYLTLRRNDVCTWWPTKLLCARHTAFYLSYPAKARGHSRPISEIWSYQCQVER
jgi:hypothetical protein